MTTQIMSMTKDVNGLTDYGLNFTPVNKQTVLAATVEQHFTVPFGFDIWELIFSFEPGATVWVALNTTATLPGGSFSDTASQLNPAVRRAKAGDTISFITNDTTAEIGISLYAVS